MMKKTAFLCFFLYLIFLQSDISSGATFVPISLVTGQLSDKVIWSDSLNNPYSRLGESVNKGSPIYSKFITKKRQITIQLVGDSHPFYKIIIDPGHGGVDVGTVGINGRFEKDFTLSTALKVKRLMDLEPAVKVYLTRTHDTFIPNDHRIAMANQLSAVLFLSIHANMDANPKTKGTETFFNRKNSLFFAQIVQKYVQKATGFPDRHVKYENFRVIKNTFMPAALVEVGFMSNATEEKTLFTDQIQDKIAAAIVDGIKEYLGMK
jgi:N-acetylmuramoyl-L-alanine amidase